ncbi:MAG: hypothetical protein SVY53_02125 [Chloroflexota bacterium]|nr:hypothetical protein [Chloroflexota bacterium]
MRIGNTIVSAVALYNDGLWGLSITYRVLFVAWRIAELSFIAIRFLFLRAPILLLWTRLPVTKNITLPGRYQTLQDILDPVREAKLNIAGGRTGQMPFLDAYKSPEDVGKQQEFLRP